MFCLEHFSLKCIIKIFYLRVNDPLKCITYNLLLFCLSFIGSHYSETKSCSRKSSESRIKIAQSAVLAYEDCTTCNLMLYCLNFKGQYYAGRPRCSRKINRHDHNMSIKCMLYNNLLYCLYFIG